MCFVGHKHINVSNTWSQITILARMMIVHNIITKINLTELTNYVTTKTKKLANSYSSSNLTQDNVTNITANKCRS